MQFMKISQESGIFFFFWILLTVSIIFIIQFYRYFSFIPYRNTHSYVPRNSCILCDLISPSLARKLRRNALLFYFRVQKM